MGYPCIISCNPNVLSPNWTSFIQILLFLEFKCIRLDFWEENVNDYSLKIWFHNVCSQLFWTQLYLSNNFILLYFITIWFHLLSDNRDKNETSSCYWGWQITGEIFLQCLLYKLLNILEVVALADTLILSKLKGSSNLLVRRLHLVSCKTCW